MGRLFVLLATITSLAACGSGVSDTGAGGFGTNTGGTDLIATATLSPESFSSDAFATDTSEPPDGIADELVSTDFADMTINLRDPIGRFSQIFQGVTFNLFRIRYAALNGGAPNLGPRDVAAVLNIELAGSTGTGSISIPIVDNVTKAQFRSQASGSTIFVYTVIVQAFGRDFVTNSQIVVEARTTIEIGEFVGGG